MLKQRLVVQWCMHGVDICVIFLVVVMVGVVVAVGLVVMGVVEVLGYVGDYRSAWLWWLW